MPQALRCLRCYSCEMFQVDIVKKQPKWTCKMCGEEQSLKEIYGRGTGKDCREFVQGLNQQSITFRNSVINTDAAAVSPPPDENKENKWLQYITDVDENVQENDGVTEDYRATAVAQNFNQIHINNIYKSKNSLNKWKRFLRNKQQDPCLVPGDKLETVDLNIYPEHRVETELEMQNTSKRRCESDEYRTRKWQKFSPVEECIKPVCLESDVTIEEVIRVQLLENYKISIFEEESVFGDLDSVLEF